MNIKGRRETEADPNLQELRSSRRHNKELVAKHASQKDYADEVVRSLSALVNRHAFKTAMTLDRRDEFDIVYPERVLNRMRPAPQQKAASFSPGLAPQSTLCSASAWGGKFEVDYRPGILVKLASREQELRSQIKAAKASLREQLFSMSLRARSVKSVGHEKIAGYQEAMGAIPADDRRIVELAIEATPVEKWAFTQSQLRMFIPTALEDIRRMGAMAKAANQTLGELTDLQSRFDRVLVHRDHLKGV